MGKQAIVVLSGGISQKGRLPFFVKRRLNIAYKSFSEGLSKRIILSGKFSYLFYNPPAITEARAMSQYLIDMGVPAENIFLEEESKDTISSAYFVKVRFLLPRRLRNVLVISSDFHQERATYVYNKVLGNSFTISYHFIPSHLSPPLLWQIFLYEKKTLLRTQAFLRRMRKGDHAFLTHRLFNSSFYRQKQAGWVRHLVREGKTGPPVGVELHYSLANIFRKKRQIFLSYGLKEGRFPRGSKSDFWSGRFLNFLGRDEQGVTYALKFALQAKDKETFKREIALTELFASTGITFIPTVVERNFSRAPIWYLYKVVKGRIAGRFSLDFSLAPHFYKEYSKRALVKNLAVLRSFDVPNSLNLPKWRGNYYQKYFDRYLSLLSTNGTLSKILLGRTKQFFYKHLDRLSTASLYLSHNDLHPANIICSSQQRRLYFIDFEHTSFNNIAFDFCFGYLFSWENKHYQQDLLKYYLESLSPSQKEEFTKLFPPVYTFFLVWFLYYLVGWKYRVENKRYHQAKKAALSQLKLVLKNDVH